MPLSNLERMIQLAEEFFETKNDPAQLAVTPEVMERLRSIHPATLSEEDDGNGPVAWVLVIPTSEATMRQFINRHITESALLGMTRAGENFEAVYLCSALVLPEHRGKGLAKRLTLDAVNAIRRQFPIRVLYCWSFSPEGRNLAVSVAHEAGLPLLERPD